MTKRNTTKPVRVVSPIMEEQETSASTLQEWLDKEETVSDLLFSKGELRPIQYLFCRKLFVPSRIYFL